MLGEPGVWATTGGAGKVLWDFVKACFLRCAKPGLVHIVNIINILFYMRLLCGECLRGF